MKICIFGAASSQIDAKYKTAACNLGKALAEAGHTLVFGGGGEGMMGAAARGFHAGGGYVISICPEFFKEGDYEALYDKNDEVIFTNNITERISLMEDMSDAFIVVPGGIGTYEEFFKVLVSRSLQVYDKPLVLLNVDGYFEPLINMIRDGIRQRFINALNIDRFKVFTANEILELVTFLDDVSKE